MHADRRLAGDRRRAHVPAARRRRSAARSTRPRRRTTQEWRPSARWRSSPRGRLGSIPARGGVRLRAPRDRPFSGRRRDGPREQRRLPHLHRGGQDRVPAAVRRRGDEHDPGPGGDRLSRPAASRRRARDRRPARRRRHEELRARVRGALRRRGRRGGEDGHRLVRLRVRPLGRGARRRGGRRSPPDGGLRATNAAERAARC